MARVQLGGQSVRISAAALTRALATPWRCSRCQAERPRANLTQVVDELVCPECLAKQAEYQISHQKPIRQQ
jgi:hypothetical protein